MSEIDYLIWEKAKKPWSKEVCEARYCFGEDQITHELLSQESGVKVRTLKEWSRTNNWVAQRRQAQFEVSDLVQAQVSQAVSDRLADDFLTTNQAHRLGFELLRKFSLRCISQLAAEPGKANILKLQKLASIYELAVSGERRSLGADFHNLDYAVAIVHRWGYEIHEPCKE